MNKIRQVILFLITIWLVLSATHCTSATQEPVPTELANPSESSGIITVENVAQLQQVASLGAGEIRKIALTPDGKTLLVASANGVHLYDIESLEGKRIDVDAYCNDLVIDPSGIHLALASNTVLQIWDISTGQVIHTLDNIGPYFSVAFNADGSWLAAGSKYSVRIWDVETGNLLHEFLTGTEKVLTVAFSPDGTQLLSGGGYIESSYTVQLWDINSNSILFNLDDWEPTDHVAFSPDGKFVAAVGSVRLKLWDAITGNFLREILVGVYPPAQTTMDTFIFSPDGKTIIGDGYPIMIWSVDGNPLNTLWSEADNILLFPDNRRIISQIDSTFKIWDLSTGQIEREFTLLDHISCVCDLAFSPDGRSLATVNSDDTLRIWDVETKVLRYTQDVEYEIWRVAFHPNGEILAYGGCSDYSRSGACVEGQVTLWNIDKRQIIGNFNLQPLDKIAFNPNGQTIAASANRSYIATLRLYDIHSGKIRDIGTSGINQGCYNFVFNPDGSTLIVYCADPSSSRIHFFDAISGELLKIFTDTYSVDSISPDGRFLAAIFRDANKIQIWDAFGDSDSTPLYELEVSGEAASSVAFGIDSRLLAAEVKKDNQDFNHDNNWLEFWDVVEGKLLHTIDTQFVNIAFSPDGKYLATGDSNGIVYLWGIQ